MFIKNLIKDIPDFPIKGVLFRDITPVLSDPTAFALAISEMTKGIDLSQIDAIAGIESRGFILASAIAVQNNKGFIPIRKKGKLPPPVESHSYTLEYGVDVLEIKKGTGRILLVDDVLATGGTVNAALSLCEKAGYEVVDVSFLINLKKLNSFQWNLQRTKAVVEYD